MFEWAGMWELFYLGSVHCSWLWVTGSQSDIHPCGVVPAQAASTGQHRCNSFPASLQQPGLKPFW